MDLSKYLDPTKDYSDNGGSEFKALPEGRYTVRCEEAGAEEFNGNTSIKFKCRILGPTNANRVIFPSCLIVHSNPIAQNIGRSFWQSMKNAINKPESGNTDDFINEVFDIQIKLLNIADLKNQSAVRESSNGKRYVYGAVVDSDDNYNNFTRCLSYQGEENPFKKDDTPASSSDAQKAKGGTSKPKSNEDLPPFLRK